MADHTYGITEIVGTSPDSLHQAIRNGISRASQTVRNLDWFEVGTIRGYINNGDVAHFQVQMKVGFRIEEAD
jgi:flavin-binding protein dodecin